MRKPLFSALAIVAIVAAACGGGTTESPSATTSVTPPPVTETPAPTTSAVELFDTAYAPAAGTDGGTLIIGDWQEANEFNPYYYDNTTEANVASATWSGLIVQTYDYKYAPDLAAEIPTTDNGGVQIPGASGDAMTVTWKLRDGLKWSDGQPLTCDDFVYTHDWNLDPDNTGLVAGTTGWDITTFDCASDTELVVHFSEIYEGYLTLIAAPLPKHYLSSIPMTDQVQHKGMLSSDMPNVPVSGAFKFESVTPGQELRLARNTNYVSPLSGKSAHLDSLIFKWYGDPAAMIAGFRAGDVDFATDLAESDVPGVADLGDQVSKIPALVYEFLRPNWADGSNVGDDGVGGCSRNPAVQDRGTGCPMADPAMRQAVAYAIDKNEVNTRIMGGNAQVANGSVPPLAWFYSEQPSIDYDPAKAKEILDAAGWTVGADGIREKNGLKAKIELCTTNAQRRVDTLALLVGWLKDVGIDAVANPVAPPDIFAAYNEGTKDTACALSHSNFDLAEHAFGLPLDPLSGYFNYHSSQFEPNGANDAQVSDPGIDSAYDTVKGSVDLATIRDAMDTIQQIFYAKTVEIPLYVRQNIELASPAVGNYFANGTTAGFSWNAVDWYVNG
jgi:peptide/nickel transport system substrate-binding protein